MDFSEAVGRLDKQFPGRSETAPAGAQRADISSGGERVRKPNQEPAESVPALFSTKAGAIKWWHAAMVEHLTSAAPGKWAFADGPHLDTWPVTIQDSMGTHRIAAHRYSVTATVAVVGVMPKGE